MFVELTSSSCGPLFLLVELETWLWVTFAAALFPFQMCVSTFPPLCCRRPLFLFSFVISSFQCFHRNLRCTVVKRKKVSVGQMGNLISLTPAHQSFRQAKREAGDKISAPLFKGLQDRQTDGRWKVSSTCQADGPRHTCGPLVSSAWPLTFAAAAAAVNFSLRGLTHFAVSAPYVSSLTALKTVPLFLFFFPPH